MTLLLTVVSACAPESPGGEPPNVALVPPTTTDTDAPTTPASPTTPPTSTAPWSDPEAVWDCPAPGTICRYAGGGSVEELPAGSAAVPTRVLGGSFTDLAFSPDLGLVANLPGPATHSIVALGPDTSFPLLEFADPECLADVYRCSVIGLSPAGPVSVFVAWGVLPWQALDEIHLLTGQVTPVAGGPENGELPCLVGESARDCNAIFVAAHRTADGSTLIQTTGAFLVVDGGGTIVHRTLYDDSDAPLEASYPLDELPSTGGPFAVHGDHLYLADKGRSIIWKVDTDTWTATWFAGRQLPTGRISTPPVYAGDDGPALDATFNMLRDLAADDLGQVYVGDHDLIRVIGTDGMVRRLAGQPEPGIWSSGDGGMAVDAWMYTVDDLVIHDGFLYFIDTETLVRRIWLE